MGGRQIGLRSEFAHPCCKASLSGLGHGPQNCYSVISILEAQHARNRAVRGPRPSSLPLEAPRGSPAPQLLPKARCRPTKLAAGRSAKLSCALPLLRQAHGHPVRQPPSRSTVPAARMASGSGAGERGNRRCSMPFMVTGRPLGREAASLFMLGFHPQVPPHSVF